MKNQICLILLAVCLAARPAVAAEEASPSEHTNLVTWAELFPDGIQDAQGNPLSLDVLKGKTVCLFFAARWFEGCLRFTPTLKKYYETYKDDFEVVFISIDKTPAERQAFIRQFDMTWPMTAFDARSRKDLQIRYRLKGLPLLVIIKENGEYVTRYGRKYVDDGVDAKKWRKARFAKEPYTCGGCPDLHYRDGVAFED